MPSLEALIILLLVIVNGVFAMAEIALVASRRVRLQRRADLGDRRAEAALRLKGNPTNFLSTVQVGITLVGILAGAYGGATVSEQLAQWLGRFGWMTPHQGAVALTIVVTVITYLSLVVGELVPKGIALSNPEGIVSVMAAPMAVLSRVATPLVALLTSSTNLLLRLVRVKPMHEHAVTEEEIRALVKQAAQSGDVEPVEQQIVEKVFRLGDRQASGIMTPRHDIDWIDIHDGVKGIREHLAAARHPRLLFCDGELDKVLGIADAEVLLEAMLAGRELDIAAQLRPPLFVPATISVFQLLETFRSSRVHIAVVLDEFGAVEGLVTPADILEGLVGEMPSDRTAEPGPIVRREDGSWLVDGTTHLEELEAAIGLAPPPDEERGAYQTIAGFTMARLSRIPRTGDRFAWDDFRFEVVDMDGRRVDKVLVTRVERTTTSSPAPRRSP